MVITLYSEVGISPFWSLWKAYSVYYNNPKAHNFLETVASPEFVLRVSSSQFFSVSNTLAYDFHISLNIASIQMKFGLIILHVTYYFTKLLHVTNGLSKT